MSRPSAHDRNAGLFAIALGVVALVAYVVLGASPESPGLPTVQLVTAALLIVGGESLRRGTGPSWGPFVVGVVAGLLAYDLLSALLA